MLDPTPLRFIYSCFGLFVGTGFMVSGVFLFVRRISLPKKTWVMRIGPFVVSDAAPGIAFAFLGAIFIWMTRF